MNFKEATDGLLDRMDQAQLAKALGVSVALVRQARLRSGAGAHRSPPKDWRKIVEYLARQRVDHYAKLVERLRTAESGSG